MKKGLIETGKFIGYMISLSVVLIVGPIYKAAMYVLRNCADFDKDSYEA